MLIAELMPSIKIKLFKNTTGINGNLQGIQYSKS